MKRYQWEWIETAEKHGRPFHEILRAAMQLAQEFPSRKGYHHDVLEQTEFMLKTVMQCIHDEKTGTANDPVKVQACRDGAPV